MKILMITDKMEIGGAETHIYTLISEMIKRGENVTLLSSGGVYADGLMGLGVKCIFAPLDKRGPFSVRYSLKIIKRELKKHDMVHAHTRFSAFIANLARGEGYYPPIVTTAHLNFPLFPFGPLAFWGEETLAVSYDIENYLTKSYHIPKEKIKITKNAIDTTLFPLSRERKKLIVHTSRIDTGRSLTAFMLVGIAEKLLSAYPQWRILIVGDGNKFKRIKEITDKVNERLGFNGVLLAGARSDIPDVIRYGAIFVGVSRSAIEGMASGISTIICGDEGYGGIACENNFSELEKTNFCARGMERPTPDKLFSDIEYLINNDSLRCYLGSYLRDRIEKDYTADSMANDALECYKKAYKKPSICLVGFFGYNNLGDEETLNSAIHQFKEREIGNIAILSGKSFYNRRQEKRIKIYNRMDTTAIANAVNSSDILILCGGNLLQNETSTRSLLYYSQIISYARSKNKRIYMISSGFGEIRGALGMHLIAKSIAACDFCGCRTTYDLNLAIKYTSNVRLMPDLCFLLPERPSASEKRNFAWIVTKRSKIATSEIKRIEKARGLTPILIMLYKNEDKDILERVSDINIKSYAPHSFEKLAGILSECSFTICERLHGAIFSMLCHVPSYISVDSCKNKALLSEVTHRCGKENKILLPYNISDIFEKKEIGAQDSDFKYLISEMKSNIKDTLNDLF